MPVQYSATHLILTRNSYLVTFLMARLKDKALYFLQIHWQY
jgi:hypothetical protein